MLYAQKTSRLALALLATTMLTQPAPARAAPGCPLQTEFQVNTFTTSHQMGPAVAMDADGDFVVAWHSYPGQDGWSRGVFAQRFDARGIAQGPEFQVNTFTTGEQHQPAVAMGADGDFVVAWESHGQGSPQDGSLGGVFARRFDAAGMPQGPEIQVNSYTTSKQARPAVAMDADGDFVVAWDSRHQDGSEYGIFAQRFSAAGEALGEEFQVNTFTTGEQRQPAVAMDADGDFVVTWSGPGPVGGCGGFARRFDAAGVAQDAIEFPICTATTSLGGPQVAMDADGDFVIASIGQDGSSGGVFAQRFSAVGEALGQEFQVNTFTTARQLAPVVAVEEYGDFVVAWASEGQDGDGWGIFAQRYDAAGVAQGPEFQVNTFTTHNQLRPAVAVDVSGDFVVAWDSNGQDGSSLNVFAQRFDGAERAEGDFDRDGNADLLWRNTGNGALVLWMLEGTTRRTGQRIGSVPLAWAVVGTGDFNGDAKTDILWRHTGNGNTVVWQMDGFERVAWASIGRPPLVWVVEKVRDTNGDGMADIVWRNTKTGTTVVWQMDGFTRVAQGGIGAAGPVWEVQ